MKTIALIILTFLTTACGTSSNNQASAAGDQLSSKPLFSNWVDNGGVTKDFSTMHFGAQTVTVPVRSGSVWLSCDSDITFMGGENDGVFQITRSVLVTTGYLSTLCSDMIGSYEYSRSTLGMVIGRVGSQPIEYH